MRSSGQEQRAGSSVARVQNELANGRRVGRILLGDLSSLDLIGVGHDHREEHNPAVAGERADIDVERDRPREPWLSGGA